MCPADPFSPQDRRSAPPDYWLSEEDCWNIKGDVDSLKWKFDDDPVKSLRHHANMYDAEVFVLQEQKTELLSDGTRVETVPFIFAICPTATLGIVRERLHGGCVSLDASFGAPVRALAPLIHARRCRRSTVRRCG